MKFCDIHIHALFGVDDGAKTCEEMYEIVDASYQSGTRYLCLTPHFHPGYYGDNQESAEKAFEKLNSYVKDRYPDLHIALGNELHYTNGSEAWVTDGWCKTLNGTKYILVDFPDRERKEQIANGLDHLLNAGYTPILAHAERYRKIAGDGGFLEKLRKDGIFIQMDTQSLFGGFGIRVRYFAKKILKNHLADFVSSDAHDEEHRPPEMKSAYEYISKKYGAEYAADLCLNHAIRLIFGSDAY